MTPADEDAAFRGAEEAWAAGDVPGALAGYRDLMRARMERHGRAGTPLDQADLVVGERLADAAVAVGRPCQGLKLYRELSGAVAEAGNAAGASYYAVKAALAALDLGQLGRAQSILNDLPAAPGDASRIEFTAAGLAAWEEERGDLGAGPGDRRILLAGLYLACGRLLAALGRYAQADAAFERGLHHAAGPVPEIAALTAIPLRLARAEALLERGELKEAWALLAQVGGALDPLRHPAWAVSHQEQAARIALLRGRLGRAVGGLRQVARRCAALGYAAPAARAYLNLAQVLVVLNQTRMAAALLKVARGHALEAGDEDTAERALWLRGVARERGLALVPRVLAGTEMWNGPAPLAEEVPRRRGRAGAPPPEPGAGLPAFDDRALEFQRALAQRRWRLAATLLAAMEPVFAGCDSEIVRVRMQVLRAMLAYYTQAFGEAARLLDQALPRLRELGLKADAWQAMRFAGWCCEALGRPREETDGWERRAGRCLRQLTLSLRPGDRAAYLLNKWTAAEVELARAVRGLVRLKTAPCPWYDRSARAVRLARGLHALLAAADRNGTRVTLRRVRGRAAPGDAEQGGRPPGVLRTLLAHPRRRATLVFLSLPTRVVTVALGWWGADFEVAPLDRLSLRALVAEWHRHAAAEHALRKAPVEAVEEVGAARAARDRAAAELARRLGLAGILERLPHRVTALTLVADDALQGFPFAALRHGAGYLVQRYSLTREFSPFAEVRGRRGSGAAQALLVGDAGAPEPAGEREEWEADASGRLKHVGAELDLVAAALAAHGVRCSRFGDGGEAVATREALLAELPRAGIFHAACHGSFRPDDARRSGLLLHPRAGEPPQVLSLRDLGALPLSGLAHATLSACWSADSFVLPGRWIVGIPETLCRAGAASVLGSLWSLGDSAEPALQACFYRELRRLPRDRAVQEAQVAAIEGRLGGGTSDFADPYWWAGLTLYGNPRRLRFRAGRVPAPHG